MGSLQTIITRNGHHHGGLLLLNGMLLLILGAMCLGPRADAQNRGRSEYLAITGGANGASGGIVYIVDTVNQEMIAVTYNTNFKRLDGIGYRNLAMDASLFSTEGRNER